MKACEDIIHINDDKIFFEDKSENTVQNLMLSKELLDSLQREGKIDTINSLMIITSSYHCRRAELCFKKYFPEIDVISCPSTKDVTDKGLSLNQHDLMADNYYMGEIRKEIEAIINYTRNGSISDADINCYLDSNTANAIESKINENSLKEK